VAKRKEKNPDYRTAYQVAEEELHSLVDQKDQIDVRITALRKTMTALATLIAQDDEDFLENAREKVWRILDLSTTDDVFNVVAAANGPVTSSDVLEELKRLGCTAIQHANPLATINAILNRLTEQEKLEVTKKGDRKAWIRKPFGVK